MQFASGQMVATQNIRYRAGALEVLLHQAQFLPAVWLLVVR